VRLHTSAGLHPWTHVAGEWYHGAVARLRRVSTITAVVLLGWLGFGLALNVLYPAAFARVHLDMDAATVRRLFTFPPTIVSGGSTSINWDGMPRKIDPKQAAYRLSYSLPLPFALFGDPRWVIDIDRAERVIGKYKYDSW